MTSAEGHFSLEYVRPGASFLLEVDKEGYVPRFDGSLSGSSQTVENIILVVSQGVSLEGVVQNQDGESIAGATVTIQQETPAVPLEVRRAAIHNPSRITILSDKNGEFEVSGLAPGSISVVCRHPAHAPQRLSLFVDRAGNETLTCTLNGSPF